LQQFVCSRAPQQWVSAKAAKSTSIFALNRRNICKFLACESLRGMTVFARSSSMHAAGSVVLARAISHGFFVFHTSVPKQRDSSEQSLQCFGEFTKTWQREHCDHARQQTDHAETGHNQEVGIAERRNDFIGNSCSAKYPAIHSVKNEALGAPV
jgi:hypothetical protein